MPKVLIESLPLPRVALSGRIEIGESFVLVPDIFTLYLKCLRNISKRSKAFLMSTRTYWSSSLTVLSSGDRRAP